ncbi:MAG TPA: hypothetical protein VNT03_02190 [Baekduia sp.]|nr:hypothetical protein [Baekduia sp.]
MLEIRGASPGLLDDPLLLDVSGAAPNAPLTWRARLRDDDGFVWRASADTPEGLLIAWAAAKPTAGPVAALRSLRPVNVDVRVEAPDGAASSRTITRTLLDGGARVRRWRDRVTGTLYLPATTATTGLILAPSPSRDDAWADTGRLSSLDVKGAPIAAALLASRGVLVFAVTGGKGGDLAAAATEILHAVPSAPTRVRVADALPLPPGAGGGADPAAWDALLADLGARPRRVAR